MPGMPQVPKITILQYLKKNLKVEVDFLPGDKHQRFLQIGTIILGVCLGTPKLPKIGSLLFFCNILKKKRMMKLIWHADKHEGFLQIDDMIFDGDGQAFPKFLE